MLLFTKPPYKAPTMNIIMIVPPFPESNFVVLTSYHVSLATDRQAINFVTKLRSVPPIPILRAWGVSLIPTYPPRPHSHFLYSGWHGKKLSLSQLFSVLSFPFFSSFILRANIFPFNFSNRFRFLFWPRHIRRSRRRCCRCRSFSSCFECVCGLVL